MKEHAIRGRCCVCYEHSELQDMLMVRRKGPAPGRGWGCVQCGLLCDGAVAMVCAACMRLHQEQVWSRVRYVCGSWPADQDRVSIGLVSREVHDHDLSRHPECL